ncbi:lytic transglycosylase domain-containing protein [Ammonifex thiophilus]|uniref:Lytic transglycosylase domain-containing protein n=1 Tax=Ammonifex thiophilus TaxID=444093 RepID=A0A3D8P5I6_9THEO|nr:lytic transglycosylase domain-containing protein [Ammonifex thiophilus]RDV83931.1 lytic transglycosylase domain-containing protein [Ammonifex thiophilus]
MQVGKVGGPFYQTELASGREAESRSFAVLFREVEARLNLPPGLLEAVARVESDLNPQAVSIAGAVGLMQLMPDTARALGVTNPFDPVQNVEAGAKYLRQLLDHFGGDLRLALAAYNAGPAAVERHRGIPPYPETRAYVEKVLQLLQQKPSNIAPVASKTTAAQFGGSALAFQAAVRAYAEALLWQAVAGFFPHFESLE